MIRIGITGPESSGKTALSILLCNEFNGVLSEEYARMYLANKRDKYTYEDIDEIAKGQLDAWSKTNGTIHFCDTEFTVLKIWSTVKFGKVSELIHEHYRIQSFTHYFICKPDIPWEPDPLREDQFARDELFQLYLNEFNEMKRPFTIISGSMEQRLVQCKKIILSLLSQD